MKFLNDGRIAIVYPQGDGKARLQIFNGRTLPERSADTGWRYENPQVARLWLKDWNGKAEIDGWTEHPASGRRRPGGDKTKETIEAM